MDTGSKIIAEKSIVVLYCIEMCNQALELDCFTINIHRAASSKRSNLFFCLSNLDSMIVSFEIHVDCLYKISARQNAITFELLLLFKC